METDDDPLRHFVTKKRYVLDRGTCRSCRAPVVWTEDPFGARFPCDRHPGKIQGDGYLLGRHDCERWRAAQASRRRRRSSRRRRT